MSDAWGERLRRALALFLVLPLVAAFVSVARRAHLERADFVFNNGSEVASLDPAAVSDQAEGRVVSALFEGLTVKHPETLEPLPGAARSWEVSPDLLTYTFHLREARWSNGDPLAAADFLWSWRRLLEPATASPYAYQLDCVRGARAFRMEPDARARAELWESVGLSAPDERTLLVELERPTAYFLALTSFHPLFPVHRGSLERCQERFPDRWQSEWIRPGTLVSNGPFELALRRVNDRLRLAKNPSYWDAGSVAFRTMDVLAIEHVGTGLNLYLAGEVDWIDRVPTALVPRLRERPDFAPAPYSARGTSLAREAWRRLSASRAARASLVFLALVALAALLAPFLPLPSPVALDLAEEPRAPELALGSQGWQHRVTLAFRLDEPPSGEALGRTEAELCGIVRVATGESPRVFRHGPPGAPGPHEPPERLELALLYRPELDPARGADLEARVRTHLAGQLHESKLHLRGGGEVALTFTGVAALDGHGELGAFDRWLVRRRHGVFGFFQLGHWLGTDSKGRDLLARVVFGSRVSLLVGLAGALVSVLVGVTWGALAGYCGGRIDALLMRVVDVLYSIPFLFVVIFVITMLDEYRAELARHGIGHLTAFFGVLGLVTWLTMARVVRAQVLGLKQREFVQAARALGASHARVLGLHIVPNLLGVVAVYLTLTIPAVMLFEAFLSFLGLGVEPPQVSWGLLAADALEAITPLRTFWWLVLGPALALGSTLLALNVLGDALRDALDPRSR